MDVGGDCPLDLCGCAGTVQVFSQAAELDLPESQRSGRRNLRLWIVRAHPGPISQHGSDDDELVRHVARWACSDGVVWIRAPKASDLILEAAGLILRGLLAITTVDVPLGMTAPSGVIEVPIANHIKSWTTSSLPDNWRQLRDRWASVHVIRVVAGVAGLVLLVAGAIYN